jgi:hypothetical protein
MVPARDCIDPSQTSTGELDGQQEHLEHVIIEGKVVGPGCEQVYDTILPGLTGMLMGCIVDRRGWWGYGSGRGRGSQVNPRQLSSASSGKEE